MHDAAILGCTFAAVGGWTLLLVLIGDATRKGKE